MIENEQYIPVPEQFAAKANIGKEAYETLYRESIDDPEGFWARMAEERLTWFKKWDTVLEDDFANARVRWFSGGKLNASYNCLDRHLATPLKNKAAIIWEADRPGESRTLTYQQLHREVCRLANVLKAQGVKKGDRVLIYLSMIPELATSVLACARIGAVHSVVFGGFSPDSLIDRIDDCKPGLIITSDNGYRGGRMIDMKSNVDAALERSETKVPSVLVVERSGSGQHDWVDGRDRWLKDLLHDEEISDECEPEEMDAEDPLFILYTSGSTGKPKGVLHTTGGYLLGASMTHYYVFDHKPEDTYWCTADIGWVTGHSYILYGPLANGATSIMFEGVPTYPDAGRFWDIVDKYQVNVFYTAPTAIRALSREGLEPVQRHSLKSLRLLGSVGEPINPEAWLWYWRHIGKERCPVVDTWWQTETGSILITPLPGATDLKPGSATRPFFGVRPVLVDNDGNRLPDEGEQTGNLCIEAPWPSMMRGEAYEYRKKYSELLGFFHTEIGQLNQIVHIWPYEDVAHRDRVRKDVAENEKNWPAKIQEFIVAATSEILVPFPFVRPLEPGNHGPMYELRYYNYKPGHLPALMKSWEAALPERMKRSPVALAGHVEFGEANRFIHIWPYRSLNDRLDTRTQAAKDGIWPPPGGGADRYYAQANKIMVPSSFSPLQ